MLDANISFTLNFITNVAKVVLTTSDDWHVNRKKKSSVQCNVSQCQEQNMKVGYNKVFWRHISFKGEPPQRKLGR